VTVELNGRRVELTDGASVGDAVKRAAANGGRRGVAVAVDGEVVPRSAWTQTTLREGQKIEIVGAIQGG
jgi:sulfur carrier protein